MIGTFSAVALCLQNDFPGEVLSVTYYSYFLLHIPSPFKIKINPTRLLNCFCCPFLALLFELLLL